MMKKKAAAEIIIARRSRGFNISRLDAKTKGVKACTIGNKRCGRRCIPREWNCRLKGEGDDSHQRAAGKGRDPLAAVASIERGIKRVRRGFTTGSFSEIEGGRRAIIRGVVKGSSKDLQQKKELQAKLINTTIGVGAVAGVAAAGFFGHARLMNSPLYARTIGRRLEDSIVDGFNRTMDTINPFRRARTATAQAAVGRASRVAAGVAVTTDPDAVLSSNRILRVAANPPETGTWARNAITDNVNSIRPDAYSTKEAWHIASVRAMWETPRTDEQFRLMGRSETKRGFYFSTVAAENFLRRQYRINDIEVAGSGLITRMSNELAQQNQAIVAYARDRRIDLSNDRQRRNLAATLVQGSGVARTPEMRRAAQRALYALADPEFSARSYARDQYRQVNRNFDTILSGALTEVDASIYNRQGRRVSRTPLITAIAEGHAEYLAQRMYANARGARIVTGPATTDLVIDNYYRVLRGTTSAASARETPWTAPRGRVIAAAREMTGRTYTDPEQALRDLQSRGAFPGLRLEPTSAQARAAQNAPRGRLVTEADLVERYLSSGRYKSREAAERAARAYIEKRNARAARNSRTDSSATARADAAKGKPCGASHISAKDKCSKPVVNSPKSSVPAEKSSSVGALKVAGTAVAASTVLAGVAVAADYKKAFGKSNPLRPTGVVSGDLLRASRRAAKAAGRDFDASQATAEIIGKTAKKQGWQAGDVVYFRKSDQDSGHFGIYRGSNEKGEHFFNIADTDDAGKMRLRTAGYGASIPQANRGPAVMWSKVPDSMRPKNAVKFTPEQITQRAAALAKSARLEDFNAIRDNCETIANMIAYDQPVSVQLQRLTFVSRGLLQLDTRIDQVFGKKKIVGTSGTREFQKWLSDQKNIDYWSNPSTPGRGDAAPANNPAKASTEPTAIKLPEPDQVIQPGMSDFEAASAIHTYLAKLMFRNRPEAFREYMMFRLSES